MLAQKARYPLAFIIAGFEHSGTTLVSEIFRQHPGLESGFEGGLLLSRRLKDFVRLEPFASNFKSGWKISDEQLADICSSKNYADAYAKIREYSSIISNKGAEVFDKTPRYMQKLSATLRKIDGLKAIVVVRDMRSIIDSTFSRSGMDIDQWVEEVYPITFRHTLSYLDGLTVVLNDRKLHERVHVVQYEKMILDQENECERMFDFLGYQFKPSYLDFQKAKYNNVYGGAIQTDFMRKYEKNLPPELISKILSDFNMYSKYFWVE